MVEEGLQIQLTFEFESSPWDHDMGVVQEGLPAEGFCVYYDKQCAAQPPCLPKCTPDLQAVAL